MATNQVRIAPRMLTQAFQHLLDQTATRAPLDTGDDRIDHLRAQLEDAMLEGYMLVWHGVQLDRTGEYWTFTIGTEQHTVNGHCSCGQKCSARAAKKLIELVEALARRYPCTDPRCSGQLVPTTTPGGEDAYVCNQCQHTIAHALIGDALIAAWRCRHCGTRLDTTYVNCTDVMAWACPDSRCPGHREYYTSSGA